MQHAAPFSRRGNGETARCGYTLVELSIVIVIVSLLSASGLAMGASMVERAGYVDSAKLLDQLEDSLRNFYVVNGRLPCVAPLSGLPGNGGFGEEVAGCAAGAASGTGHERIATPDGHVRVGMIPVRTLGLPDSAASDKFGSRIVYAVSEGLTDKADFGSAAGAITVRDGAHNGMLMGAAYFLLSHGRDRKGGHAYQTGAVSVPCSGAGHLDLLNCTLDSAEFRDAQFSNGEAASFFDDITRWAPKFHFMALDTENTSLWAKNPSGDAIYSVGTAGGIAHTRVGIGTADPQEKLHVEGGIRAGSETVLSSGRLDLGRTGAERSYIIGSSGSNSRTDIMAANTFAGGASIDLNGRDHENEGRLGFIAANPSNNANLRTHIFSRNDGTAIRTLLTIHADGHLEVHGQTHCKLGTFLAIVTCISDGRYKKDVEAIPGALDKLLRINGVYYRWNDSAPAADKESRQLGLIAQNVRDVFPEAVTESEDGYLMLSPSALVPVLIEAVRELEAERAVLERRVLVLEGGGLSLLWVALAALFSSLCGGALVLRWGLRRERG